MSIWILALFLVAAGAGMGLRQGAIRVVISFVGIILSALLAWPLSGLLRPLVSHIGIHNPVVVWLLPPFRVFFILMAVFKSVGLLLHVKATVHYKYRADDLDRVLWERLNKRVGACLGTLNGLLYFVLVLTVIYEFSYWTVQVAPSEQERLSIRILNRLGLDLQDTGLVRVARAIDPLPEIYFKTADLAGTIYQNPQLLARLSAYPAFLSLSERDDFKQLGQDTGFQSEWKSRAPIGKLLDDSPSAKVIWRDWVQSGAIWNLVETNLDDLTEYLQTGQSATFQSEAILGRWDYNVMESLTALAQSMPNMPSNDMAAMRALWGQAYAKTMFVAGADGGAFLISLPQHFKAEPNQPTTFDTSNWTGTWRSDGSSYAVTLASSGVNQSASATVDGSRLTLQIDDRTFIFNRE